MEFTLTMTFLTETGEKANISISDVKEDLNSDQVVELMDALIENDVFQTKKGSLMSRYSAYITQREVTKFEV